MLQAGASCCLLLLQPGVASLASPRARSLLAQGPCSATGLRSRAEPPCADVGAVSCATKLQHSCPEEGDEARVLPCDAHLSCYPLLPLPPASQHGFPGVRSPGCPPSLKPIPLQTSPEGCLAPTPAAAPMPTHCGTHSSAQTPGRAVGGGAPGSAGVGLPRCHIHTGMGGKGLEERPQGEAAALLPPRTPFPGFGVRGLAGSELG